MSAAAPPTLLYETLDRAAGGRRSSAPITLDEIRYNVALRDRVRSVDLNTINFETGSWEVSADQVPQLQAIAEAMLQVIEQNPSKVIMIEGHTDAVGATEDNLSLSDRRAESVAEALTTHFNIPPENLVTQGYGEQHLRVPTQGPNRENRRVVVRDITQLLAEAGTARRAHASCGVLSGWTLQDGATAVPSRRGWQSATGSFQVHHPGQGGAMMLQERRGVDPLPVEYVARLSTPSPFQMGAAIARVAVRCTTRSHPHNCWLAMRGAFAQRLELRPDDARVDFLRAGERGEAAVGARDHVLASDHPGVAADPLGYQLRMLDQHGRMRDHAGNEDRALRQLRPFPTPSIRARGAGWPPRTNRRRRGSSGSGRRSP